MQYPSCLRENPVKLLPMLGMSHSQTEEGILPQVLRKLLHTRKGRVGITDKGGAQFLSIHPQVLYPQGKQQINDFEGMPSGSGDYQFVWNEEFKV
jgi:hypothetical protein